MGDPVTVRARRPPPRREFVRARVREIVGDSFWLVPALFLVAAVALTPLLDVLDEAITAHVWWVGTNQAASTILQVVATAMLTFLGVVFSITLVALQLASQQFSPRVTRTFVRSTTTKVAFGVFSATFVVALLSLNRTEVGGPTDDGPVATVTATLLLVAASLVVFIVFVNSITRLIRVANLIAAVADETRASVELTFPPASAYVDAQASRLDPWVTEVYTARTFGRSTRRAQGVLLGINPGRLVQLARRHDCVIRFRARIGQHLIRGHPLAAIHGADAPTPDQVRRALQFGRGRTLYEDPAFGIRELVDIGAQALSPAVNAPTTAVQVIDRLTDVLVRIGVRPDQTGLFVDGEGTVRVVLPTTGWRELVDLVFTELRMFGVGSPQITRRLAASLDELMERLPAERHEVLDHQRALLRVAVDAYYPDQERRRHALHPDPLGLG